MRTPRQNEPVRLGRGCCLLAPARSSRRYEVLLPLRFSDGTPLPDDVVAELLLELERQLAVTANVLTATCGTIACRIK